MANEKLSRAAEEEESEEEEGEEVELDDGVDLNINPLMAAVLEAAENGDVDSLSALLSQVRPAWRACAFATRQHTWGGGSGLSLLVCDYCARPS
jgi:hypothetical protein